MKNNSKSEKDEKKIIFIANILTHHLFFNRLLIQKMANRGWKVRVISTHDRKFTINKNPNIKFTNWPVDRSSVNPIKELKSIISLCRIIKKEKPDIIHNFTIKANIYGTISGKIFSRAKIINTVNGLGYTYAETSVLSWPKRSIIKIFWGVALSLSQVVIFLNSDDKKLVGKYLFYPKKVVIPGHGINVEIFNRWRINRTKISKIKKEIGLKKSQLVITTAGRLIRQKGIVEFWQAAKKITSEFPNIIFIVIGMSDNFNPSKITSAEIDNMRSKNFIFLFDRDDVRELLSVSDIFVLASYREGVPQVIIEAMMMALPVITTDVAGCREKIKENINGLLVPAKNSLALYKALKKLIRSKKLRIKMGKKNQITASRNYDSMALTEKIIKYYFE